MRLSRLLSKRTRWRSRSTYAEHFVIRRAMTNYMSDITIRREDAALWSIWYHSRVARRPEFLRRLIEVEDGAVILHPAFRDSTRFFSFFSISPSTWATVQLWTEIPIELESRAAMTRRALTGNKKNWRRRNGDRNIEIEQSLFTGILRYNYAKHQFSRGIVTVVCERQCYIPRLLAGKRERECVVRNKC